MIIKSIINVVGINVGRNFNSLKTCTGFFNARCASGIAVGETNSKVTPKNREELQKLGLSKFMKKHRQYAQYNYEEWRYPEKLRAIDISCTRQVADPYKVDGEGAIASWLKTPRNTLADMRQDIFSKQILKRRVKNFHRRRFPEEAQEIYLEVHNLLNTENWTVVKKEQTIERLHQLVTEFAFPDMIKGLQTKTLKWNYLEAIEAPRVVKIRTPVLVTDQNYYGQVTVRFHSKQTMAIYDRFGRLMFGSPDQSRNVLEYVVFERHISNPYGMWRIHSKIPASNYREPSRRTIVVMKPNVLRKESKEWHDKEEEECTFKWYPLRHKFLRHQQTARRVVKDYDYWSKKRKRKLHTIRRPPPIAIRPRVVKLFRKQKKVVDHLREEGKLPNPPKPPNP